MDKINTLSKPIIEIPPLPDKALYPQDFGAEACSWLDDYIQFSRKWSPLSYDGFHEAVGLFILSTIAGRRIAFPFGKLKYTNLYIAMVGRTSIYAKTTAAEIGIATLRNAGLDWFLAPDNSTPQALIKSMSSTILPTGYDKLPDEIKQRALFRAVFPGQRGWFFDEFGMQVSSMMRRDGVMSEFRSLLRKFDDTPERYENSTIVRGNEVVERPYLALLANLTPADLKPFVHRGAALWGDGYLARFGLVTPPEGCLNNGRFPKDKRVIPSSLSSTLSQWHKRLGVPKYDLHTVEDKFHIEVHSGPPDILELSEETFEACYQYLMSLRGIISQSADSDLDGNYSRFPEKALRISALFASLNDSPTIELPHWAKAQAITERWRIGLHELYRQVSAEEDKAKPSDDDKVVRVLRRKGPLTKREISQYTTLKDEKLLNSLNSLMVASKITCKHNGRTDKYELL